MVENPPYNAGDAGSIPGQRTEIPHAVGQLSPCATATELGRLNETARVPQNYRAHVLWSLHGATTETTHPGAHGPQLEREPASHN